MTAVFPTFEHGDGTECVAGHWPDGMCREGGGPVYRRCTSATRPTNPRPNTRVHETDTDKRFVFTVADGWLLITPPLIGVGVDHTAPVPVVVDLTAVEELGPIDHGVVLVLREVDDFDEPHDDKLDRHAATVEELARVCGHTDFTLLIVDPTTSIELLDVEMMRAAGWYRSPAYLVPAAPVLESDSDADR